MRWFWKKIRGIVALYQERSGTASIGDHELIGLILFDNQSGDLE
jgi:hypothetical protein